jgi:hypothetical protein
MGRIKSEEESLLLCSLYLDRLIEKTVTVSNKNKAPSTKHIL